MKRGEFQLLKKSKFIYILLLLPAAVFFNTYRSLPSDIHLTQNSRYLLNVGSFCNISADSLEASADSGALSAKNADGILLNTENAGTYKLNVKMFNFIPVKTVDVTVAPQYSVIPSGSPVGIKIYADGLLTVNVSDVRDSAGKSFSPARDAGIRVGDRIVSAGGKALSTSEQLSKILNSADGSVTLGVMHGDNLNEMTVTPILSGDGQKKIGIWVRDSTAGVGTLTFYDPKTSSFATLGHAITDVDTGDIILPRSGSISDCKIAYSTKSTAGNPGELSGIFGNASFGKILLNSQMGVYGKTNESAEFYGEGYMPVATRFQVKNGAAYIMADVDGGGVKKYSVDIEEVSKSSNCGNKGLVIRITDPALLEKTGGIVQGMSGAPIIQNGMLVGAVTHVFVNEPDKGYGIFAENMLDIVLKLE